MGELQNQLMSISELSDLIGRAVKVEVLDAYNAIKETVAAPTVNIRAKVRYDRTNEGEGRVAQEKVTTEIKVHIRYDSSWTVLNMIYWDSKYFDIYAIEHTPRRRFTVLKGRHIEQ